MSAIHSIESLLNNCDEAYPSAGTWGYMTLLSDTLATGLSYVADIVGNTITTPTPHGLATGSRVRMVGGTLPSPLATNTDYYAIVISPTVVKLATTLALAQASSEIGMTDAGSGGLTLTEQTLTSADPLSVLLAKEISHPSWTARAIIDALGPATAVSGRAEKSTKLLPIGNTSGITLAYRHILFIESAVVGVGVLGNIPAANTGYQLRTEAGVQTIGVSDPPRVVLFSLRVRNA